MIISLKEYAIVGRKEELHEEFSRSSIKVGTEEFNILDKSEVVIGLVCEERDKVDVTIKTDFTFTAECDRCLERVDFPLNVLVEEKIEVAETETIDTDEIVIEEIMLKWPMKILCTSDCKGLCLKCGRNLNTGSCGCDTFIPDPRMAAIKDIFESER